MNGLKNLAGHDVSIFLCQFVLIQNGIDFILNEAIAADMYPDIDVRLKPLVHACCETLLRYRHLSVSNTIMDINILDSGEGEVMLSRGLGRLLQEQEKQNLFADAQSICDLLGEVMARASEEQNTGVVRPKGKKSVSAEHIQQGLEELGQAKYRRTKLELMAEGYDLLDLRPGLPLPELPRGVSASPSYDHRGLCLVFRHATLGDLGKVVFIETSRGRTRLSAEVSTHSLQGDKRSAQRRKKVFVQVLSVIESYLAAR